MTAAAQRAVARNDPCPCGSGRRYKDCHGSIHGATAAASTPLAARSRYRPAGDDWASIAESDRDRLGALMERALVEQKAARVREAERLYRAVLEEAPHTHDALHMLGIVRLGLGDFTDAERLIRDAMALRPEYPAIATNWSLVQRSIAARDRRGIEIVSEHALPLLVRSLAAPGASAPAASLTATESTNAGVSSAVVAADVPLHVVGGSLDVAGDATWLIGRLHALLAPLQAQFWIAPGGAAANGDWQRLDGRRIDPVTGRRPRGGRVVLAGVDGDTDAWLRDPIDAILVFMLPASPSTCLERLRRIAADGARSLTLVFDSHAKASRFGAGQLVLPPPIDVAPWQATPRAARIADATVLRVAACGQDRRRVAVPEEADHLRAIAASAGRLDLFDPGPLREPLGASPSVVCVAGTPRENVHLVAQSDVYLHRVSAWWAEDCQMLFDAMLAGLAVLCPRASMYAEYVADGVDGWLYDDHADALRLVAALRNDPRRVRAAGTAARNGALARFAPATLGAGYANLVQAWMRPR